MDILTHMFFTYLINFGIGSLKYNEYAMVFGIALGMIPDLDVLMFPLGWKYSSARHRGASHSVFFIIIASIILAAIFAPIIKVDFLALCAIGMISGLSHISLDAITTIGIPVFWPFSKRELHLDLERAINPYFMGISVFLIFFLFQLRAISYNYTIFLQIIGVLTTSIILYYFVKLTLKIHLQIKFSTPNFRVNALPTAGLFKWFLVAKKSDGSNMKIKYCRFNLLARIKPKFRFFSCLFSNKTEPPLDSKEKVLSYSFNLKEVNDFIRKFKYPLAHVLEKKIDNSWTVFWFPLELMSLNRVIAIRVDLDRNGGYKSKHAFFWKYAEI